MGRKDYTGRDHQNTRILGVADPVLGTDGANKNYIDGLAAGAAPNLQDRWSGTINSMIVPNAQYIGISNLTATVARGITHNSGSFVPSRSGVYVITGNVISTVAPSLGSCAIDIAHIYDGTNARIYRGPSINQYFNITASWGMDIYKTFYFAISNNSGATLTLSGVISIVRVSEV
jgi:hypothetical protein